MADWGKLWDSYLGSYSDPSFDPGALGGDVKTLGSAIGKATGLGPTDTSGINSAAADAKALEQMFLQQMGQSQAVPGLVQPNGTVVGQPAPGAPAYTAPPAAAQPTSPAQAQAIPAGGHTITTPSGNTFITSAAGPAHAPVTPTLSSNQTPPSANAAWGSPTSPASSGWGQNGVTLGQSIAKAAAKVVNTGTAAAQAASPSGRAATATAASPMAPAQDTSQSDQFRAGQMALAGNLQAVLNGQAPSVAQLQQQQAFQQQQAQQLGMAAAAGRGGNQALALRAALGNVGQLGAQQAGQSALLRANEQATARSQMGDVVNSGRAQDIGIAGANQQSQIGTRQQNINQAQNQAQNVLGANQNEQTAAGIAYNAANQRQQQIGNLWSTGLSLLSDERAKTDVKTESPSDIREFLAAINPVSYRYKMSPQDQKVGVIAQDVERSKVGKTFVKDTPAGKAIDVAAATGPFLAAIGHLHRRLNALEQRSNPVERGGSTDTIKAA